MIHVDDFCSTCQYRLNKYGTADPNVSWSQLKEVLSKAKSTSSKEATAAAEDTSKQSGGDGAPGPSK